MSSFPTVFFIPYITTILDVCISIQSTCMDIMNYYPLLKQFLYYVYHLICGRKMEPHTTDWIGFIDRRKEHFVELEDMEYERLIKYIRGVEYKILRMCTYKSPTKSAIISDKSNCCHALFKCEGVKKDGEKYVCWLFESKHVDSFRLIEPGFLSVRYRCEKTDVFFDIPKEFLVEHNQLFTEEFVRWWIEYRIGWFVSYSPSYTLDILDSDLDHVTLTSQQYILLETDSSTQKKYKVVNRYTTSDVAFTSDEN